jgi:hypothetical protein
MIADLEPLRNQAQDALVRDTVLEETDDPRVGHGIEGSCHTLLISTTFRVQ